MSVGQWKGGRCVVTGWNSERCPACRNSIISIFFIASIIHNDEKLINHKNPFMRLTSIAIVLLVVGLFDHVVHSQSMPCIISGYCILPAPLHLSAKQLAPSNSTCSTFFI